MNRKARRTEVISKVKQLRPKIFEAAKEIEESFGDKTISDIFRESFLILLEGFEARLESMNREESWKNS